MTSQDAIRFLDYQATWCRSRDEHQALCLLLPGLMRAFGFTPMRDEEARAFTKEFKAILNQQSENKKAAHNAPPPNDL